MVTIYHILLIEQDPMLNQLMKNYLMALPKTFHFYTTSSFSEVLHYIEEEPIDIIIIDIDIWQTDISKIMYSIRHHGYTGEFAVISSNSSAEYILKVINSGALDYLIKPFEQDRFQTIIKLYDEKRAIFNTQFDQLEQDRIDKWLMHHSEDRKLNTLEAHRDKLEKGYTWDTLKLIADYLKLVGTWKTIKEISTGTQLTRVTVSKYMDYLERHDLVTTQIEYETLGRPATQYKIS